MNSCLLTAALSSQPCEGSLRSIPSCVQSVSQSVSQQTVSTTFMGEMGRHDTKCGKHRGINRPVEGPAQPGGLRKAFLGW